MNIKAQELSIADLLHKALQHPGLLDELKVQLGMTPQVHPDTPVTPDQKAQAFTRILQHGVNLPRPLPLTQWPSYRFKDGQKRLFASQAELDCSGDGWFDSRADMNAAKAAASTGSTSDVASRGPGRPKKVEDVE